MADKTNGVADKIAEILLRGVEENNADPGAADERYLARAKNIKSLDATPPAMPPLAPDGSTQKAEKK